MIGTIMSLWDANPLIVIVGGLITIIVLINSGKNMWRAFRKSFRTLAGLPFSEDDILLAKEVRACRKAIESSFEGKSKKSSSFPWWIFWLR
jgi:flagellar motor component MotA